MTAERSAPVPAEDTFPIARSSLAASVADHLRAMIVQGTLPPGTRVQVAALAASLAVSATPVREALIILAEDRLVELLPNRGARVLPYTADEALALFEVMAALEALAARLATMRMHAEDCDELERRHAAMVAHHRRRERQAYFAVNNEIHAAVLTLSGNPDLVATHARLELRGRRGRYNAIVDDARWDQAMHEHALLMEAMRCRDAEAAASIWQTHVTNTGLAVAHALHRALDPA
ncbi:GntR family transcriptional regulator [Lichenihabitans sp. Uapishka_5]|uniref:GntR family transcriptional regulator n=1 Tax=Lichenihabitans sp. Uapishka_5 TaxID=3037302 RepID=UPI0029E828BA|nr:GntR family transcriptional regulator [Lichenihabitans sp. Uapishka_5]MDX7950831.1 GntR family transcriptional regulator [Lichenihabitans sp. Uapishka_5]